MAGKHKGKRTKVFRDPIHDLICIEGDDAFILDLIDTKEFQRLRRIKQLGLSHFVYPGAEHSRFTHSLGVYNFARRMIEKLTARHKKQRNIVKALQQNQREIKAAALLHDIGHGPFSHVLERVFPESPDHEKWTCKILLDKQSEVNTKLRTNRIEPRKVASIIADGTCAAELDLEHPEERFLKDIVSSQLDADRMDYLLRDSLMTGSRYGQYDSEWILNAVTIGTVKLPPNAKHKTLCLEASKGTGAIEGLLQSRLLMTQYVYGHTTTRAYEGELIQTLLLAAQLVDDLPDGTPKPVRAFLSNSGRLDTKSYLMLDDEVVWWAMRRWAQVPVGRDSSNGPLKSALRRHALNLIRRKNPWRTHVLNHDQYFNAETLVRSLRDDRDSLVFECYADDVKILPYKDMEYSTAGGADDDSRLSEIHLVKDDETVRLSTIIDPTMLEFLSRKQAMFRFHHDRKFDSRFARHMKRYGVC